MYERIGTLKQSTKTKMNPYNFEHDEQKLSLDYHSKLQQRKQVGKKYVSTSEVASAP